MAGPTHYRSPFRSPYTSQNLFQWLLSTHNLLPPTTTLPDLIMLPSKEVTDSATNAAPLRTPRSPGFVCVADV